MKVLSAFTIFGLLALSGFAFAQGEEKEFASCYGDHHGSYVSFVTKSNSVAINITGDGEGVKLNQFTIKKVTKDGKPLQPKAYSWAIRQAIKAEATESFYGLVMIKAVGPKNSRLYINLNKMNGESYVVIDGYAERLTCPLGDIKE